MSNPDATPFPAPRPPSKHRRPLGQRIIRRVVFTLGGFLAAFVVLGIIGAIVGPPTPVAATTPAPAAAPAPVAPPAPPAAPAPTPPTAVPVVAAPIAPAAPAEPVGDTETVTRVVDGDTFLVPSGKVRVLVMDSCESGTPGGTRATAQANQLLAGQTVTLTAEPGHDHDSYGRMLRYVTLADGRDYADTMLEADHTAVYAGDNDASAAKVADGYAHDPNGRTCGTAEQPASSAPTRTTPSYDAPDLPGAPSRHTGHSGHPCGPGERDGDHDGYCGEGR